MKRLHCQPQTEVTVVTWGGRLPENHGVENHKNMNAGFSNVQLFDLPEHIFFFTTLLRALNSNQNTKQNSKLYLKIH